MDSLCRVRNKIMYVLSWRTGSALTRVLFLFLFPLLLRNSGNKHKKHPLVSVETVRHSSTYIILYIAHLVVEPYIPRPRFLGHQRKSFWCKKKMGMQSRVKGCLFFFVSSQIRDGLGGNNVMCPVPVFDFTPVWAGRIMSAIELSVSSRLPRAFTGLDG